MTKQKSMIMNANPPSQITDQMQHMQRLQLAGTLASGIAHDLNNELTLILGNIEVAKGRLPYGNDAWDWLDLAARAANRCAAMSRRLLDLSRDPQSLRETIEVTDLIEEARLMLECMKPRHAEIVTDVSPSLIILGDSAAIHRVLVNLGLNAFQAMPSGGTLKISVIHYLNRVHISFADTGCGIPVSLQKRIFEPFFTTRAEAGGSGLGLATASQIMQNHAGSIIVESRPKEGSTFTLDFPIHPDMMPLPVRPPAE